MNNPTAGPYGYHPYPPPAPPRPRRRRWLIPAAIGAGLISLTLGVAIFSDRSDGNQLTAAVEACDAESSFITVIDDGSGLTMSSQGEESPGASILDIYCVLDELDTPQAVTARMDRTRALDGTQDATWSGLRASWTYHPDSGFAVIIEPDD